MPRSIDHEARRKEIISATKDLIVEKGIGGLSFREIGRRLGGSSTKVTHYYPTQAELMNDLAARILDEWSEETKAIEDQHPTQIGRLNAFLFEWALPITERGLMEERLRINLLSARNLGAETSFLINGAENRIRELFTRYLRGLVPPEDLESTVDLLRAAINGIALSAVEHSDHWTPDRQINVLRRVTYSLNSIANESFQDSPPFGETN